MTPFTSFSLAKQKALYRKSLKAAHTRERVALAYQNQEYLKRATRLTERARNFEESIGRTEDFAANDADNIWGSNWRANRSSQDFKDATSHIIEASAKVRAKRDDLLARAAKLTAPYDKAQATLDRRYARLLKGAT